MSEKPVSVEADKERKVLLYKMRDPSSGEVSPYPQGWKLPAKMSLTIGIPENPRDPIWIIFCTTGGSTTHGPLGTAIPYKKERIVKGLSVKREQPDKKMVRVLRLFYPPVEDKERMDRYALRYADPRSLIDPLTLQSIKGRLGAEEHEFRPDPHLMALKRLEQGTPPSGTDLLKREMAREGD